MFRPEDLEKTGENREDDSRGKMELTGWMSSAVWFQNAMPAVSSWPDVTGERAAPSKCNQA